MKKIAVLLPVFILALFYFKARYHEEYAVAGLRGKASLAFGVCIMFLVMILGVYKKKQETFLQGFIQSSFLVYVFMVLTLTGYFIFSGRLRRTAGGIGFCIVFKQKKE